jgi:hypothetical protein
MASTTPCPEETPYARDPKNDEVDRGIKEEEAADAA